MPMINREPLKREDELETSPFMSCKVPEEKMLPALEEASTKKTPLLNKVEVVMPMMREDPLKSEVELRVPRSRWFMSCKVPEVYTLP